MKHKEIYDILISRMNKTFFVEHKRAPNNSSAISFFGQRVARIFLGKQKQYIEIFKSESHPSRYDLNDMNYDAMVIDLDALWKYWSRNASVDEFGCCSHFYDCSDFGRCLFENQIERYGCAYKKNLDEGRIFYGKNRNIKDGEVFGVCSNRFRNG